MQDTDELYERLNILDGKCSALLQLSSLVLAVNIIPAARGQVDGLPRTLRIAVAVLFLIVSLLSLYVIRIEWQPTEGTVQRRTTVYRLSLTLTAIGLVVMAVLIITSPIL